MKHKSMIFILFLLPFLIILSFTVPKIIWIIDEPRDLPVYILTSDTTNNRLSNISWPFIYKKSKQNPIIIDPAKLSIAKAEGSLLYVTDTSSHSLSDEQAILNADSVKRAASISSLAVFDGSSISETHHQIYRNTIEDFLQVNYTKWSILFVSDNSQLNLLPIPLRNRIIQFTDKDVQPPFLILSHEEGELYIMENEIDFSGNAPIAINGSMESEIFQWIPIYESKGNSKSIGYIDLQLTDAGLEKYLKLDLPKQIPISIENDSNIVHSWFYVLDLLNNPLNIGSPKQSFKAWYFEKIALFQFGSLEKMFWKIYLPMLSKIVESELYGLDLNIQKHNIDYQFRATDSKFLYQYGDEIEQVFFIKGVNLGPALPGKWFTDFPVDENIYYEWFTQIKEMNLNTVRIYTLLPPAFYRALYKFNLAADDNPLFLIQEIWPEEHPIDNNYLAPLYISAFEEEISKSIDAVHGNADIAYREGRAWGIYTADITPWLISYLIGRELEPDEVLMTNSINRGYNYSGTYIAVEFGSPSEAWLASACDFAVNYEFNKYGIMKTLGIVSWPTLDPLYHPSEWRIAGLSETGPYNDIAIIDINNFSIAPTFEPGFYGAYHIYPNYPDFMNNQESYSYYNDKNGVFRYGGYLREFITQHTKFPAVIAEYGISTSTETAHVNPEGYNHGGLTEQQQAEGIIRMTNAIVSEGYAGAIIFEWIDEWAKKTWITEPFMLPYARQVLWHNIIDPEQNYGIISLQGNSYLSEYNYADKNTGLTLLCWGNEAYLYIDIEHIPLQYMEDTSLFVGFDTYMRDSGIYNFPNLELPETAGGMEFLLKIELNSEVGNRTSSLLAIDSYNIGLFNFASTNFENQNFSSIKMLVNRAYYNSSNDFIPNIYTELGVLNHGSLSLQENNIYIHQNSIIIRIPWGLLNITDPSSGTVLNDSRTYSEYPLRDIFHVAQSESILINGVFHNSETNSMLLFPIENGSFSNEIQYIWENWDTPQYIQNKKRSYKLLQDYFSRLN